jgi:hypothetical protein
MKFLMTTVRKIHNMADDVLEILSQVKLSLCLDINYLLG